MKKALSIILVIIVLVIAFPPFAASAAESFLVSNPPWDKLGTNL